MTYVDPQAENVATTRPMTAAEAARTTRQWVGTAMTRGWRPLMGWAVFAGFVYAFIIGPYIGRPADAASIVSLVIAGLGQYGARSFERVMGRA